MTCVIMLMSDFEIVGPTCTNNLYHQNREIFFIDLDIDINENRNVIIKKLCEKNPRQFSKYLLKIMDMRKNKIN